MIVSSIVRAFQLLFTVIVLALSITAARWQVYGPVPAITGFNAFAGAFGLLVTLIGFAAIFIEAFPGFIVAILDLLAFIFLLAGGIAYAVYIRGSNCSTASDAEDLSNPIFYNVMNEGAANAAADGQTSFGDANVLQHVNGNCRTVTADTVFLFFACFASLAAGILALLAHRRGRSRSSAV